MRQIFCRIGLALLALSVALPVLAQNTGSLRGTVNDASGAVIQGATVKLTNEATKFSRQATSDAKGGFYFASVDPGNYTLRVDKAQFKPREIKGVSMSPSGTVGLDVTLEVGNPQEIIVVEAEKDVIPTVSGAREGLITSEQIENISMIGRNPMELLRILPGVVMSQDAEQNMETAGKFSGASGAMTVNGMRTQNVGITLDGSNLRDIGANSGTLIVPNNDMVSEVKVQYSNYAAEFGSSGVNIQAITKGGASEFHGSIYDYYRHYSVAANDHSRDQVTVTEADGTKHPQERPKSKFNYPGFNLSGPVIIPGMGFNKNRDKMFFFVGVELSKQMKDNGSDRGVTFSERMRTGDFGEFGTWCAQSGNQHLNMGCTINVPGGYASSGTAAPGGNLAAYASPLGLQWAKLYPLPNYQDPTNRYNYIFSALSKADRDAEFVRIDYNISESTRAYLRLARDVDSAPSARGLWWNSSGVELPSFVANDSLGRSAVLNVTSILSPTVTNEVIASWSQLKNDLGWENPEVMMLATYGLQGEYATPFGTFNGDGTRKATPDPWSNKYLPQLIVDWGSGAGSASAWSANDVDKIFSYNGFLALSDSLTKVLNTHAVKVGVRAERQYKQQNFNNTANGQLVFSSWTNGGTGNSLADIAVGRIESGTVGTPSAIGTFVAWNYEGFVQDSWKVSKSLTLEYGVRLGKWTNNIAQDQAGAIFLESKWDSSKGFFVNPEETDPSKKIVNGFAYVKRGDVSASLTDARPFLVMPRLNFAWDVKGNGSTVVRGGAGIFYTREQGNTQYDAINLPPNAYNAGISGWDVSGGMKYSDVANMNPWTRLGTMSIKSVSPTSLDWPRATTASLSVAKRLFARHVLEVGYVGTWSRHQVQSIKNNLIQPGAFLTGTIGNSDLSVPVNRMNLNSQAIADARPLKGAPSYTTYSFTGRSDYHSLQATLSKYSGKFTYLVSYTFSKSLGTIGNDNNQDMGTLDPFEPTQRSYGILPTDRTHVLNASWTWQLGNPIKSGALAKAFLNGWNFSGVSTYYSGTPLRLQLTGDLGSNNDGDEIAWWGSPDYTMGVMPTYSCDPRQGAADDKVLNISCMGIPTFPNSGPFIQPYYVRTPSRMNHDVTVFKNFGLGGDRKLQVRVGAFNVLNQAYPLGTDIDSALQTTCNSRVNGVPNGVGGTSDNVCDPAAGYTFTQNTLDNFGKVITRRGHRVIEFALKLMF